MAASFTRLSSVVEEGGYKVETGTWTSSGGTTTVDITVDTTNQPEIVKILDCDVSSNGDTAVNKAYDIAPGTVRLTFTANDSGTYRIKGKCA